MTPTTILHSGPPVTWERMCGPMKGGVIGGLIYEGLAKDRAEAEALAASGRIAFEPCHAHGAVGPMAGIVTAKMPVWIFENAAFGNRAYCTVNEGLGKVLRYGAFSDEVLARLRWIETELAPVMKKALKLHGPIDMKSVIAQALQMGDEGHNRNRAGTSLIIRELAPTLVQLGEPVEAIVRILEFPQRQRPLLPQSVDAGVQVRARRRPRRQGQLDDRRHGAQRNRLRRPDLRPRRPLVHRTGFDGGRASICRVIRPLTRRPTSAIP